MLATSTVFTGCSGGAHLSGIYCDATGLYHLTFKGGNKGTLSTIGGTVEVFEYKVNGKRITVSNGKQTQTLEINGQGCIVGMGPLLCKRS